MPSNDFAMQIFDWIRNESNRDNTQNPEGYTEIQSYHVWEVLNAIEHLTEQEST